MFSQLIRSQSHQGERTAMVDRRRAVCWRDWIDSIDELRRALAPFQRSRIAISLQPSSECLAALAALDELGCDTILLDERLGPSECRALATELKIPTVVDFVNSAGDSAHVAGPPLEFVPLSRATTRLRICRLARHEASDVSGSVTLLTSGTSGKPKAVRHTWASLARPIRSGDHATAEHWLLSYPPHLYAGLQVILQCVASGGVLVVDDSQGDVRAWIRRMQAWRVGYTSATPSYWRRILMLADPSELAQIPLVQVTLGGEVADAGVLQTLSQLFPQARIVHIYATSELGRCFSVTDRKPGFPRRFLDQKSADGVELMIADGELLVRSENRMAAYDATTRDGVVIKPDGWTHTGDLVEILGDRVYFVGRRSDIINVGGNKVAPLQVEQVIRQVPGILDVRVFPQNSSIAGQLVACEIVPAADVDNQELKRRVAQHCHAALAGHARPRWITIVDQIALTSANKVQRGSDATSAANE